MTRSLSHFCSFSGDPAHRALRSFPTRRSSDLLDLRLAEVEDRAPISRPCLVVHDSLEEATVGVLSIDPGDDLVGIRSEEHTSELQSRGHLVCRLLLEKNKARPRATAQERPRAA